MKSKIWTCGTCGEEHIGIPDSYGYEAPWTWYIIPDDQRTSRSTLSQDYCIIDDTDFFVRGCVLIPIIGRETSLIWGVWVSLSKANFDRERSLAEDPRRTEEPAYFGWLSSRIEIYPDTAALKTNVHSQLVGLRPVIELEPTDYPLAVEHRTEITEERVIEIAERVEHGWRHPRWDENPS